MGGNGELALMGTEIYHCRTAVRAAAGWPTPSLFWEDWEPKRRCLELWATTSMDSFAKETWRTKGLMCQRSLYIQGQIPISALFWRRKVPADVPLSNSLAPAGGCYPRGQGSASGGYGSGQCQGCGAKRRNRSNRR